MARRKKADSGGATSEWLNTYADMVTLLLTFFILLYSMSSLDAAKFDLFVKAVSAKDIDTPEKIVLDSTDDSDGTGGLPPTLSDMDLNEIVDIEDIYESLSQYIEDNDLSDNIEISQGDGYVFIRFMDGMLFEPNSARLKTSDLEILNFVGYGIKSVQDETKLIRIDGHTAAVPEDPNYPVSDRLLSSERANAVLMYFEDEIGIDSSKLLSVGFGKWVPIAENANNEGRQQNRRVEILISSENLIGAELDTIYEKLVE